MSGGDPDSLGDDDHADARRIGAKVATGSLARKSTTIVFTQVGLLDEQPMRGAGDDRELSVGQCLVQGDRMLKADLVVVADHHQRPARDRG